MKILRVKLTNIKWPKSNFIHDDLPTEDDIVFDGSCSEIGRIHVTDLIDEFLDEVYLMKPVSYEFEVC